jgi:hypothetical protein
VVFRAARSSRIVASFSLDIPWLSGLAVSHWYSAAPHQAADEVALSTIRSCFNNSLM